MADLNEITKAQEITRELHQRLEQVYGKNPPKVIDTWLNAISIYAPCISVNFWVMVGGYYLLEVGMSGVCPNISYEIPGSIDQSLFVDRMIKEFMQVYE